MKKEFKKCIHLFLVLAIILTQVLAFTPTAYAADTGNLALGKTMTANNYTQVYVASNANDGNVNTYWEGAPNAYPNTLTLDLGSAQSVYKVVLKLNAGWGSRTQTLSVLTSTDNANYTTCAVSKAYTFNPTSANTVTITFTETSARYIRLNLTANSGATGGQIAEFEVYGTSQDNGGATNKYEGESAAFAGGTKVNTDHTGYSGTGFVDGYWNQGATTTFTVNAAESGNYDVTLRYANSMGGTRTLSIYVNGTKIRQTSLANLTNWDTWADKNEALSLNAGSNTIAYKYDSGDSGNVNLDYITVKKGEQINQPDMIVTDIKYSPESPKAGDLVTFSAVVKNQGTANGAAGIVAFKVDGNQVTASANSTTAIAAGGTLEVTATGTWSATAGTHALNAVVDNSNTTVESNEGNNSYSENITIPGPTQVDLIVDDITYTPANPAIGNTVTFSAVVKNQGTAAGAAGIVVFKVDGVQVAASANSTTPIASNGTLTVTGTGTWTATGGTHTLEAIVDNSNTTAEADETNNTRREDITISGGTPDLIVTDIITNPPSPLTGNVVTFSAVVKNDGTGATPAGTIIGVSFSVDGAQVSWSDNTTASLAAGNSITVTSNGGPSGSANWTATQGTHSVVAWVDDVNRMAETNENNNQYTKSIVVTDRAMPDLVVSSVTCNPLSAEAGGKVTVTAVIKNQGNAAGAPGVVAFSADGTQFTASSNNTTELAVGGTTEVTATWTASSAGSHTISAAVDSANTTVEGNETNNTNSVNFTVTPKPGVDLIVSDITWNPSYVTAGSDVTFSATVKNQGTQAGAPGVITFKIDGTQVSASANSTTAIAAGSTATITASGSWAAVGGAHTVTATVDANGTTNETDDNNNSSDKTITVYNNEHGATMPYTRYESEDASIGGGAVLQSAPTFDYSLIAAEASNQKYVELPSNGSYVEWTINKGGAGVNMRFTMPDSSDGMGLKGSLDCYVNGVKVKTIDLSSYWMYQYFNSDQPMDTPGGSVTRFKFDEVHWKLDTALKAGDKLKIQKTNGDGLKYGVDFVEVEPVPTAIPQPANSLSVTSYGATPDDNTDDLAAFTACVNAAAAQGKSVYIPAGKFNLDNMWVIGSVSNPLSKMTITGAGMWHTNIQFTNPKAASGGISFRMAANGTLDFGNMYINSMLRSRYGQQAIYKCFMDNFGTNSRIHDFWEDHFECGFWVGDYAHTPAIPADGLIIENGRIRNNLADGVNFCQGTKNSTVQNCSVRNNGDDGLAMWNDSTMGAPDEVNNSFLHNTVENNWRAAGIAIFGGSGHKVQYNYIKDCFKGSGIRFNTVFPGHKFANNTGILISENTIVNSGTSFDCYGNERGAIDLEASNTTIKNITFENINIINAQRDAITFGYSGGFSNITFNNINIVGTGKDGQTKSGWFQAHKGIAIFSYTGTGSATFNNAIFNGANLVQSDVNNPDKIIVLNGFNLTIQNSSQPDFVVNDITYSPANPVIGDVVTFSAVVKNQGTAAAAPGSVIFKVDGTQVAAANRTTSLAAGSTATITGTGTWNAVVGTHALNAVVDNSNATVEISETNNSYTENIIIPGPLQPDMIVTDVTYSPASPAIGNTVTFSAVVKNQGTAAGAAGIVVFKVDGAQVAASANSTTSIAPDGTLTVTGTGTWTAIEGIHKVDAIVDNSNTTAESNETNNSYSEDLNISGPNKADLIIEDITYSPASPAVGNTVTFSAVVKNQGTGAGAAGIVVFKVDGVQVAASANSTTSIAPNGTLTVTGTGTWNATIGTHALVAIVDNSNTTAESNEANNSYNETLIIGDGKPDLVVTDIITNPASPLTGNVVTFSAVVKNQGTGATPAGTIIGVSFSVDGAQVSWSDNTTTSLAAGNSITVTSNGGPSGSANWTATLGTHSVVAWVDDVNRMAETDENNNQYTESLVVTNEPMSDLVVTDISWNPASPEGGNEVTFSAIVKNQGNAAAAAGVVTFKVDGTEVAASANSTASIAAGATATITATSKWSASVGTHTISAAADSSNSIAESNENNNSHSESMTVTPKPGIDLVVTDITTNPLTPITGNTVTFSAVVSNQGTVAGTAGIVVFKVDGVQVATSVNSTTSIPAGSSLTISASSNWVAQKGYHALSATADNTNTTAETIENNNTYSEDINILDSNRGANMPFTVIEAESSANSTNGTRLAPNFKLADFAGEASGRSAVLLDANGEYVEFTLTAPANAFVLRNAVAENTTGTISIYADGVDKGNFTVTSKFSYVYATPSTLGRLGYDNSGSVAYWLYEDSQLMLDQVYPKGTKIRIQKDAGDVSWIYLDLLETENVAPAASNPDPSKYVQVSSSKSIEQALNEFRQDSTKLGIFIPAGTWEINSKIFIYGRATQIIGAGPWHTKLTAPQSQSNSDVGFNIASTANGSTIKNLSAWGNYIYRQDGPGKFIDGNGMQNVTIENVWAEHFICLYWGVNSSYNTFKNCRIKNTFADGINMTNGSSYNVIDNCYARGNGDDAFALFSAADAGGSYNVGNKYTNLTAVCTRRAACFAVYGGSNNLYQNLYGADTLTYPGITISSLSFGYNTLGFGDVDCVFDGVTLDRTGGDFWTSVGADDKINDYQNFGAIWFFCGDRAFKNILVKNVDINNPVYYGLMFQTKYSEALAMQNVRLENININNPTRYGIKLVVEAEDGQGPAVGGASFTNVKINNPGIMPIYGQSGCPNFIVTKIGSGNNW